MHDRDGQPTDSSTVGRRRTRLPLAAAGLLLLVAVLAAVFVVPPESPSRPTDLVVVLGGLDTGSRLARADQVVAEHPGAVVLVYVAELRYCPEPPPQAADLVCLVPEPATTRGEAQMAAAFAAENGLSTMTVVTTADQLVRARLRFARCWDGGLLSARAPTSVRDVVANVPYQVAAMGKALVLERPC